MAMALSVSPDLTVYEPGRADLCSATARAAVPAEAAAMPERSTVTRACATEASGRAADCVLASAGVVVNATAAATPNSAGAAAPGSRCAMLVRALLVGLPKGLLPE